MVDSSLPPTYSRFSLPAAYECVPVPTYTELAHTSERVLNSAPASPIASRETPCHPAYVYRTDHLEVDLGRSPWGLQYATYGKGGVIDGSVKFTKKCSHVVRVTVTLLGSVTTKASEHPFVAVPQVTKTCVVSKMMTLHGDACSKKSETITADKTYMFTILLPETVKDHPETPLPPTFTTFHPAAITDVEYSIQVDVVRKGFHRREMFVIPILYFPKTQPHVPELPVDFLEAPNMMFPLDGRVKRINIEPKYREDSCIPLDEAPSTSLLLPSTVSFASGSTIPVSLVIKCPSSPALAQALCPTIGLFLVKRKKIWVNGGRQISVREQLVYKAETFRMSELSECEKYLSLQLKAGESGSEYSFKVPGAIEVEHFVRVIIRPPAYLKHLPVFQHDEPIKITTDQHGTIERELLMMGGVPMPALGLASSALRRTVRIATR